MADIETIHETDGTQIRRVTNSAGKEFDFVVDESGDLPSHTYRGDGEVPQEIVNALDQWVAEYHDVDGSDQGQSVNEGSE